MSRYTVPDMLYTVSLQSASAYSPYLIFGVFGSTKRSPRHMLTVHGRGIERIANSPFNRLLSDTGHCRQFAAA